ncbi:Serine/threonine protein kinase [Streptomyces aidingensis]|uniref:non-specific serine/threonine protein kinase n=1 Tax=Streptomyces aidingensis TaxID=910347 RepID=A0A1I1UV60_9ACTN|nr:Serine/threonine protein kinase [Streptomyces aidingensis]
MSWGSVGLDTGELLDGRFLVEEALDQGGMGAIWTATEVESGQTVAVKTLRRDAYAQGRFSPAEREELLKRFQREGVILAELDHPAIPRLLHRGWLGDNPYLVMEYVGGHSLRQFLASYRPFPFGAAMAIAVPIAEALHYAHHKGVVHRDLKPGNVVIAHGDGAVKLLDFGIAHLTDPDATRYTRLGATPGSAGYMAPEQIRGREDLTAAVDLYAFGCVLFELLTGEKPFEDKLDRNKDIQHLEDPPPRLQSVNLGIPQDVDDLVDRLLAKAPADRPGSVQEALDVLHAYLPKPGDPPPDPELVPDPTVRYRSGEKRNSGRMRALAPHRGARRPARRHGAWLNRALFHERIRAARAELLAEGPGGRCAELSRLTAKAAGEWGPFDRIVVEAQLLCADAERLDGDTDRAQCLYEEVVANLRRRESSELRPMMLEAALGIAECRVPAEDLRGALDGWREATHALLSLDPVPQRLAERSREIALELSEWGYHSDVAPLVARLPAP